jgi:hypothetical protein
MEWFNLVQKTILQFGIDPDKVYNFNETGFAIGLTATAKVITRNDIYGRRAVLRPGNREWVTIIECTNASGWALPPYMIFKGKGFIESWFDGLPDNWRFELSPRVRPPLKLDFVGLKSSLFLRLLRVRKRGINF